MLLLNAMLKNSKCEFKSLKGEELDRFLDRGKEVDGVRYPTPYVALQGEGWGMYLDGKLLGGYVIALRGTLRTMAVLEAKAVQHRYKTEEVIELGGVWVEKEYRIFKYTTCIWLHMLSRIKFHKRPYLIYGYNLQRTGLQKMYAAGNPHVLYRGPVGTAGIQSHSTASVEVVNTKTAIFAMMVKATARFLSVKLLKSERKAQEPSKDAGLETLEIHRTVLSK